MRRRFLSVDASAAIAIAAMVGASARAQSLVHDLKGADRSEFGWSIAFVGDLDGDGTSELAIGSVPETAPGYVTLVSGATGAVLRVHVSTQVEDFFGFSVAGVGDVDGDGVPDYAAGAPHWFVSAGFDGSATVYSGKSGALLWSVDGGPDEQLGFSIAGVGDVDGNGRPEVLIGRMGFDGFSLFDGGGAPLLSVEEHDGNALGWSVAEQATSTATAWPTSSSANRGTTSIRPPPTAAACASTPARRSRGSRARRAPARAIASESRSPRRGTSTGTVSAISSRALHSSGRTAAAADRWSSAGATAAASGT
jgi:hypothetical protein